MNRNVRKQSAVIAKQGKEPNHKIRILPVLLPTIMAMMLTLICFIGATWAWFSDTVQTGVNTIEAGSNTEITVQKQATDGATNTPVEETKHGNQYTYNLEAGTYEVTINPSKDLHQEFVVFELGTTKKYIQLSKEKSEETVTVHASENNTSLKITTKWGTPNTTNGEDGTELTKTSVAYKEEYVIRSSSNTSESTGGNNSNSDNNPDGTDGTNNAGGNGDIDGQLLGGPGTTGTTEGSQGGTTGTGDGSGTGQGNNENGGEAGSTEGGDGTAGGGNTTTTGSGEGDSSQTPNPDAGTSDDDLNSGDPTTQGGSGDGEITLPDPTI